MMMIVYQEIADKDISGKPILSEMSRKFTRGSIDPFFCFPGRGTENNEVGEGVFMTDNDLATMEKT